LVRAFHRLQSLRTALVGLSGLASFVAAQAAEDCTPNNLAPWGIEPSGALPTDQRVSNPHCKDKNGPNGCLISFKDFKWWTGFNYVGQYYNNAYYYNGGLYTAFAPEHAFVDDQGLHLVIYNDVDLGDPNNHAPWTGGEAVLMFKGSDTNNPVSLTYGDYLVTAKPISGNFQTLDPNVALGIFTYERYGQPPAGAANCGGNCKAFPWPTFGPSANPSREIDLAEISRWGWNQTTGNCPFDNRNRVGVFNLNVLCKGNAQFAIQDFSQNVDSVQRYDIGSSQEVTLVLRLRKDSVKFEKYTGSFNLKNLPSTKQEKWSTPQPLTIPQNGDFDVLLPVGQGLGLKQFIPVLHQPNVNNSPTTCAQFHINFWLGDNISNLDTNSNNPHPPPTTMLKQEVIITNFEYNPLGSVQRR
jgi:hypothetical protein